MFARTLQNVLHPKGAAVLLIISICSLVTILSPNEANATLGVNIINGSGQTTITTTSIVSSPTYIPRPGETYLVLCTANAASTLSITSSNSALTGGLSTILNQSGTASMLTAKIIPTITPGTNDVASTITCTGTASATMSLYILRPFGFNLATVPSGSATGTSATWSIGTVAKTYSSGFGMGFLTSNVYSSFTNPWINPDDPWTTYFSGGISSGAAGRRSTVATGYSPTAASGSFYGTINAGVSAYYRGQVIVLNGNPIFTTDIVSPSLTPIASPTVAMTAKTTGFSCQTSTGTLGTAAQKIMTYANTNSDWSLSIAPTAGVSALWTSGGNTYDFNDPAGSGCTNGQLSLNFSTANWSNDVNDCAFPWTDIVQPTGTYSFSSGSTDAITIMSSSLTATQACHRFVHSIGLSQTIPAEKLPGTYTLPMTLTLTAL